MGRARRGGGRRAAWAAMSLAGLSAAAAFVYWAGARRSRDAFLTPEAAESFDLQEAPEPSAPEPSGRPAGAAAAPVSSLSAARPLPEPGMSRPAAAGPAPARRISPAAASRFALAHSVFGKLLRTPAKMLAERSSALSSGARLRAFLNDRAQVEAYLNAPLVRAVLNSPEATRALLRDPRVARAVLQSPAFSDPTALSALLRSALIKKILDCPGPQEALADLETVTRLVSDPQVVRWLGGHPEAVRAMAQAAPELAGALPAPALPRTRPVRR